MFSLSCNIVVKPPGLSLQFEIRPDENNLFYSQGRHQDNKGFLPWPLILCWGSWPGRRPCLAFLLLLRQRLTSKPILWVLPNTRMHKTLGKDARISANQIVDHKMMMWGKVFVGRRTGSAASNTLTQSVILYIYRVQLRLSPLPAVYQLSSHRSLGI